MNIMSDDEDKQRILSDLQSDIENEVDVDNER